MTNETAFDRMSDLCIEAGEHVMKHGSGDLQAAMRVLLAVLGREIALRLGPPPQAADFPVNAGGRGSRGRRVH